MRFYIKTITLWMTNGKRRTLNFLPNKVNIITGSSGTGKTEIMSIIDYCLFSSKISISEEIINENVEWYGLTFVINEKEFTIAREKIINRKGSKNYYFSSKGDIPENPFANISESSLKELIQSEFSIDNTLVIPYGGNSLKAGSKISFRYFLLFNTQSENIISNNDVFFDKQNTARYREALERIFDIALKIEDLENVLIKEKISSLTKEIAKEEKKQLLFARENDLFSENIKTDIRTARQFNLLDDIYINPNEFLPALRKIVDKKTSFNSHEVFLTIDKLNKEKNEINRKIRNFKRLSKQYSEYILIEKKNYESLRPINYIKENYEELLIFPETAELLKDLEDEFISIKKTIKNNKPFNMNIKDELKILEDKLMEVEKKISQYPDTSSILTNNEVEKFMFIGELKYKIKNYEEKSNVLYNNENLEKKKIELENLKELVIEDEDRKELFKSMLEGLIQKYLDQIGSALDNYQGYKALFNYKDKALNLRKENSIYPSHIGSSSNHMFMHLSLFLGLHEASIIQQSPFIPQFLILDQPSRPYYGEEEDNWSKIESSDQSKITTAMKLLDDFIDYINNEYKEEFQFIVLEHIPKKVWEDLKNFHCVDEFRYGNALIVND